MSSRRTLSLQFFQVVLVEPFGFGDRGPVPLRPLAGLVSADEKDRLASRVEDEQHSAVLRCAWWSEFFEVVVVGSFDPVGVWSVELGSLLGEEFHHGDHGILLGHGQGRVPVGKLVSAVDLPHHQPNIDSHRYRCNSISSASGSSTHGVISGTNERSGTAHPNSLRTEPRKDRP